MRWEKIGRAQLPNISRQADNFQIADDVICERLMTSPSLPPSTS